MGVLRGGTTIGGYLAYHAGNLNVYEKSVIDSLLLGKANTSHTHTVAQVTNLQTELNAKETPAGAQAKVNAHSGDNVAHITAAERTSWNIKTTSTERRVAATANQTTITIGIPYVKAMDTLLVFQEGIHLYEGEHFTVNAANTAIVLIGYAANLGDSFKFLVIKDCKPT